MPSFERRAMLRGTGAAVAAVLAASALPASAETASMPRKPGTYDVMKLPFDPQKIKGMSEKILLSHYQNNYTGAVKRLNQIAEQLAALDFARAPTFIVNGLKREELIAANSMILHEIYFSGLGEESAPGAALASAIARDFGSMYHWQAEFVATGKALGGGSGWVILTYDPRDKRLLNSWAADHTMGLAGGTPLLVLDMYEHAYQMDYGAKAPAYIDAFMHAVRWANADRLFEHASRL